MEFQLLSNHLTQYYCDKICMPKEATDILKDIVNKTLLDPKLLEKYREFYESYLASGYWMTVWEPLKIDPYIETQFGNHASLFYLHCALERLPLTLARYKELGLDEALFTETLRDISTWVTNAYNLVGYYCIRNISWIWRHIEAKLFRIGRLQYMPIKFKEDIKCFKHQQTGNTLLLCGSDMAIRINGDMQGVCGKEQTSNGFITSFEETNTHYIGYLITPYGKCLSSQISLAKTEWEYIFGKGDYILDIHIPRDGDFSLSTIQDSYILAKDFFRTYFPEYNLKGMFCSTWLFTPQLQEILSPASKIVQFQRSFYLYPHSGSKNFLWNFVFDELTLPENAPTDTYLRQQVLAYVNEDKELFDLKGLYLDASGSFGEHSYMDIYDKSLI